MHTSVPTRRSADLKTRMIGELRPKAGRLLLAEQFMLDPNFRRSVVYLTEYNDLGAVGFVLNQPSILTLKDIIEDINEDFPVYIGGPVENTTLHFLHLSGDRIDESREVSEGIYCRSEERRLGKEWFKTFRSWGAPD